MWGGWVGGGLWRTFGRELRTIARRVLVSQTFFPAPGNTTHTKNRFFFQHTFPPSPWSLFFPFLLFVLPFLFLSFLFLLLRAFCSVCLLFLILLTLCGDEFDDWLFLKPRQRHPQTNTDDSFSFRVCDLEALLGNIVCDFGVSQYIFCHFTNVLKSMFRSSVEICVGEFRSDVDRFCWQERFEGVLVVQILPRSSELLRATHFTYIMNIRRAAAKTFHFSHFISPKKSFHHFLSFRCLLYFSFRVISFRFVSFLAFPFISQVPCFSEMHKYTHVKCHRVSSPRLLIVFFFILLFQIVFKMFGVFAPV